MTQRFLDAGLVIFGKTNTPEFGAKGITEPELWGPARNPWNTAHTPGGSSGGSGAAVAAGIVPAAGANDGGGSVRIPAACNGLVGLKTSRGVGPYGPQTGEVMFGMVTQGVVSRTVRDSAALLDAIIGPDPSAGYDGRTPADAVRRADQARRPGRLRIGYSSSSAINASPDPEAVAAVESAAALLAELGHEVEEVAPPHDDEALARDFLTIWFAQLLRPGRRREAAPRLRPTATSRPTRWRPPSWAGRPGCSPLLRSLANVNDYIRALAGFHETLRPLPHPDPGQAAAAGGGAHRRRTRSRRPRAWWPRHGPASCSRHRGSSTRSSPTTSAGCPTPSSRT